MNEVEFGVTTSLSNAGNITIGGAGDKRNAIHKSKVGILVNHTGTGKVSIINNEISSVAEDWGGGIALFFNHAPATVKENRLEAYGYKRYGPVVVQQSPAAEQPHFPDGYA